jgi:hypothetical protein
MKKMDVFTFLPSKSERWSWGRENKGSGYKLTGESRMQTAQGCGDPQEAND